MADAPTLELPTLRALHTTAQMDLLDVVDSLRAQGLSEITALPQLIVCGDQSSGKSSVLEALSGVPFPRQENLCTRFATEVILRRAPRLSISVSIVPARERKVEERQQILQFRHDLTTRNDFPGLFEKAKEVMGLSGSSKTFANDILRVEFCGPAQPQLTLVDLPGLIHSETRSQTAADVELVTKLVATYLANPRSIILAVVSAKNDIGNQIILRKAREVDPQGTRTLGIITKPDTLKRNSVGEESFITLARNEDVKFNLGWHVVKNLDSTTQNAHPETRDKEEAAFFRESNFKNLPSYTLGIAHLRKRLSHVLFNQIRVELPRLIEDIETRIDKCRDIRDKIGPGRPTVDEQRAFLIKLSQSFHEICRDAVRGDYDDAFFQIDMNKERRLCANLMNKHFAFAENMRKKGSYWSIVDVENEDARCRTREEAINEACKLLKRSRGRELPGLPNPLLVGELFREYSRPWESLARAHIKSVWDATIRFLELVLQHLTESDICDKIMRLWLYPIMEQRLDAAYGKLNELLEVHKEHPITTNHHFLDNRKKLQQKSTKDGIKERMRTELTQSKGVAAVSEVFRIVSSFEPIVNPDMDMVAAEDAFDNMNAFYEVAIKLFMDNVPTLAVQAPIVREVPKILCPTAVFSMDAELVTKIAGESEEKTLYREEILERLKTLEDGARTIKQHATRSRPQSEPAPPAARSGVLETPHESQASNNERKNPMPSALPNGKPPPASDNNLKLPTSARSQNTVNPTSPSPVQSAVLPGFVWPSGNVGSPKHFSSASPDSQASTATASKAPPGELFRNLPSSLSSSAGPKASTGLFSSQRSKSPSLFGSTSSAPSSEAESTTLASGLGSQHSKSPSIFGGTSSAPSSQAGLATSANGYADQPSKPMFAFAPVSNPALFQAVPATASSNTSGLFGGFGSGAHGTAPVSNHALFQAAPATASSNTSGLFGGFGSGAHGTPRPSGDSAFPAFGSVRPSSSPDPRQKNDVGTTYMIPNAPTSLGKIFVPYIENVPNSSTQAREAFQSIGYTAPHFGFSFEETRLADYAEGSKPVAKSERVQ